MGSGCGRGLQRTVEPGVVLGRVSRILSALRIIRPRVEVDDLHFLHGRLQRDHLQRRGARQLRRGVAVLIR